MKKDNFVDAPQGALYAKFFACPYDGLACSYDEVDDERCIACLEHRIAVYHRILLSIEDKFYGTKS